MTVYFIGAGPGDPELLTLKAARIIGECPVCLYAGSLVPAEVVAQDLENGYLSKLDWKVPFGHGPIGVSLRANDDLSPAGRAFKAALHQAAQAKRDGYSPN